MPTGSYSKDKVTKQEERLIGQLCELDLDSTLVAVLRQQAVLLLEGEWLYYYYYYYYYSYYDYYHYYYCCCYCYYYNFNEFTSAVLTFPIYGKASVDVVERPEFLVRY